MEKIDFFQEPGKKQAILIHWNLDVMKGQGTCKICSRFCYIKVSFHRFFITGVKKIIHYTEDFIRGSLYRRFSVQ